MYKLKEEVYLCTPKRSPLGSLGGALSQTPATEIGSQVIKAILSESDIFPEDIDEVILGSVLMAGQGQAPARQVAIKAGLPKTVQAMTLNKVCSSGLKAIMLAANSVELGQACCVIAGGIENMSLAPYYLPKLRSGARLGHVQALDSIVEDGLWDPYGDKHMGSCAELCAKEFKLSREAQDKFALRSYERAIKADKEGLLSDEIVPITVKSRKGDTFFEHDEEPARLKADKVSQLKPAFEKDGTVTAANASSINDGAAAILVCSKEFMQSKGLTPFGRLVAQGWHGQEPEWFTTAPVVATQKILEVVGKTSEEIDLFEVNEAFAAVALAYQASLNIADDKLNIHGGAVAMGHPIGVSGARILVTLLHALKRYEKQTGIAAICNGGGEATAVMVERV